MHSSQTQTVAKRARNAFGATLRVLRPRRRKTRHPGGARCTDRYPASLSQSPCADAVPALPPSRARSQAPPHPRGATRGPADHLQRKTLLPAAAKRSAMRAPPRAPNSARAATDQISHAVGSGAFPVPDPHGGGADERLAPLLTASAGEPEHEVEHERQDRRVVDERQHRVQENGVTNLGTRDRDV